RRWLSWRRPGPAGTGHAPTQMLHQMISGCAKAGIPTPLLAAAYANMSVYQDGLAQSLDSRPTNLCQVPCNAPDLAAEQLEHAVKAPGIPDSPAEEDGFEPLVPLKKGRRLSRPP